MTVTCDSNTVGPYQHLEKVLPLGEPLPLYGDGRQERDDMDIRDHCAVVATVLRRGVPGGVYNVGTETEMTNSTH